MAQRFSHTQYQVDALVAQIDSKDLSLPDLQRPFVWKMSQVRDLFDSLYHGYPAGYFLFWSTSEDVDQHGVGAAAGETSGHRMIVDGQQRLTSLYAVMKEREVIMADNTVRTIRISFNPLSEEFAVADAARDNDPEWISNISTVWAPGGGDWSYTNGFIGKLSESREVTPEEMDKIGNSIGNLAGLRSYQFSALELSGDLDIDEVAEVFVRINSKGVGLNSADFILTLMSVYRKEARHRLEDFSVAASHPPTNGPSPYNHFLAPSPDQLLRVAVGLGMKRGVLQNAYQYLRGRDPKTNEISEERREAAFNELLAAQAKVLDLTSWHEYMVAVKRAGYRSRDMLTSNNNFLYCYLIFLIGRHDFSVPSKDLRDAVARWFFMSSLTGRYTGSPETILESDLRRFAEVKTPDEFVSVIDHVISTQLTDDFWNVTLPEYLESSGAWSPYLFGYYASLNLLDAKALFSEMKINDLFDPGVKQPKSPVEKHHLFPKAYLASIGITGMTRANQIANFAFVEWSDNIAISDQKPSEYFPEYFGRLAPSDQELAAFWHALPPRWEEMDYFDFLRDRRHRMAMVVRRGFEELQGKGPKLGGPHAGDELVSVSEILRRMETDTIEFKQSARASLENDAPEKVINDGVIKSVAAFLNSSGGTLAIGINDAGDIVGIQHDLDFKRQDLDGYQNWLSTLLIQTIGAGVVGAHVGFRIESVGSELVCLVDVSSSPSPVYAKTTKGEHCFFVRVNNTTRQLDGPEIQNYIAGHWTKG